MKRFTVFLIFFRPVQFCFLRSPIRGRCSSRYQRMQLCSCSGQRNGPSHTSHKLQPYDIVVSAPLKACYHDQVDRLEQGGVNTISKEHFTSLYSPSREAVFTAKKIKAGFAASRLFPLNPDTVLRRMLNPPAEQAIPRGDEVRVGSCRQDRTTNSHNASVSRCSYIATKPNHLTGCS